ncbi:MULTISPECIES: hypothetical protein [unclassified Halomonas]|uniref:hypothetical protein n=1 Tax=unclassified Halomonas TaxID=2609666 RepID=UPI00246986AA|nr:MULTISPECIES: hypothetical protein [unclassified Halomonas]
MESPAVLLTGIGLLSLACQWLAWRLKDKRKAGLLNQRPQMEPQPTADQEEAAEAEN